MRDRLIELLQNVPTDYAGNRGLGAVADHLLKNDVVPVVRCKDCKLYTDNMNDKTLRNGFCGRKTAGIFDVKKPTDYCSYGEREEELNE